MLNKILSLLLCLSLFMAGCGAVAEPPMTSTAVPSPIEATSPVATKSPPTAVATDPAAPTAVTVAAPKASSDPDVQTEHDEYDYELAFPSDRYSETALHINGAIAQGYSDVCTIDRDGAEENRKESLAGINTKDGYDRDEWPMAMCEEGGAGASVAYIDASDNRGAGSWVGNQLEDYPDGTRILFIVEKPKKLFPSQPAATTKLAPVPTKEPVKNVYYKNCTAVRAAGADPIHMGEPGYSKHLDRDGDGVGCE